MRNRNVQLRLEQLRAASSATEKSLAELVRAGESGRPTLALLNEHNIFCHGVRDAAADFLRELELPVPMPRSHVQVATWVEGVTEDGAPVRFFVAGEVEETLLDGAAVKVLCAVDEGGELQELLDYGILPEDVEKALRFEAQQWSRAMDVLRREDLARRAPAALPYAWPEGLLP